MNQIYLDYNASTPIAEEVQKAILPFFKNHYGNPSALHYAAAGAKQAVEKARKQVAALINGKPSEIVFTSGASEANNNVLKGVFQRYKEKGNHIITTNIEHPSIISPCEYLEKQGAKITYIDVDPFGRVNPRDIEEAITEETILISVMHANNEVGTLQPIEEISEIAKKHHILFHTDASQSVGKVPVDVEELGVDFLSIAGHKVYAPKGIGVLFMREGMEIEPLIHGAGHEGGRRAGTENVLLVVGLGEACEVARQHLDENLKVKELRDYFWDGLRQLPNVEISLNGHPELRLPNTLSINFENRVGQDILDSVPQIAASTGSACHTGEVNLSPVLKAMGVKESVGKGAVRFSLGRYTMKSEIDTTVQLLKSVLTN
ncbi:cysteine desulfurase family protein [Bacillus benzoevorans]|uniref:cysteine desulfurase n=1 Tax=Bacillus benzoevorans TaxID=1456 RepID=A0A7X0HP49_9BACI|nr:cysteine desulfurase family protein [Bacillus benzoevorans]MBB6444390.1 cysteine desulfurase [Bacillus benzoevorans]